MPLSAIPYRFGAEEAFARVGEVLVFRTVGAAVVRRLGWAELGPAEAARIRPVLRGVPGGA